MFGISDPLTIFPQNLSLLEVREAIKGRNDYKEITFDEEGFVVFSYVFMGKDTFMSPNEPEISASVKRCRQILRECRGIVFSTNGILIARRFHKFFNVNESPETHESFVDLALPHTLLVKLDGSMVSPIVYDGKIYWATKKGLNDVEDMANTFVSQNASIKYEDFVMEAHKKGITCMFEWCSKKQPIILNYDNDSLVLTGMRNTQSGLYVRYAEMKEIAQASNIPIVCEWKHGCATIKELLQKVRSTQGIEGYVLRFDNGDCLKIKTTWYTELSRGLQAINFFKGKSNEKYIWKIILDSTYDDLKEGINQTEREKLETFSTKLLEGITVMHDYLFQIVEENSNLNDAEFARYLETRKDIKTVVSLCWKIRKNPTDLQKKKENKSTQTFDLLVDFIRSKAGRSTDDFNDIKSVLETVYKYVTKKAISLSLE